MIPPVLVREEAMYGTGFFPSEKSDYYEIQADGLYLTGTSEVALASLHMGEILEAESLPLRYAGFSTNFRREAGAAGKDTRGMFRVHQFNKVETFVFTRPDLSWAQHDELVALEEEFVQKLTPALDHWFNHQTHHRGHAHMILTSLGKTAPELDLLYYQREVKAGRA